MTNRQPNSSNPSCFVTLSVSVKESYRKVSLKGPGHQFLSDALINLGASLLPQVDFKDYRHSASCYQSIVAFIKSYLNGGNWSLRKYCFFPCIGKKVSPNFPIRHFRWFQISQIICYPALRSLFPVPPLCAPWGTPGNRS